ncbi:patatin-like phospholipase family protein [Bacteroides sp. 519]|uniref:patatin-like phospholipase family protein n=1 Tax=Bacteroides sp. 519 TaxID=2302937 RepID=UPI0013D2FD33|nr:patatin-like phospholipase family protein [Bacteroides sp. 519]NDV58273.1 patatin [Bacteroides sp. 519]
MKTIISVILIILCALPAHTQERKKVAVVLSGGGAKGVAHVRALKVIEEAGIPIDYVAGTSMGALVGALYSMGYTPHQLDSMIMVQDWSFLLSDAAKRSTKTFTEKEDDAKYVITLPFNETPKEAIPDGIIKGKNLAVLFNELTIGYHDSINFNKLPIPFACVAVDLRKGKEVVFHSGKISESMRASMAIPAAFTPVRTDSMVLVDGGLINNFPVDVALKMGADLVIGVDVQNDPDENKSLATVPDMVSEMSDMLSRDKYNENMKHVDLYIKVNVKGYNAASFTLPALDTLMTRGEYAARQKWDELIDFKEKIGVRKNYTPEPRVPYHFLTDTTVVHIHNITFTGIKNPDESHLLEICKLTENSYLTMQQLKTAVKRLYAKQIYANISYTLNEVSDGYNLVFYMEDNQVNLFRLGIRFDSEEIAAILLNATYNFNTQIPTTATLTARFGKRSGARLDYMVLPNPLRFFNFSYAYHYNDINMYSRGDRKYNATYHHHLGDIGYSNIFSQDLKIGLGVRYEYFHYDNFLYNRNENNQVIKSEGFFSYYFLARYETMDKKVYPTRGTSLQADASVYTDNLYSYNDDSPITAVSLWWKSVFSITNRLAFIPSGYARVLFGNDSPYSYLNTVGGDTPGRYVPQQIPFIGINYMEIVDNSLFVVNLRLRQRMFKKHYAIANFNYGLTNNKVGDVFNGRKLAGGSIGYGYDSLFGPLEASLNFSNSTKNVEFYLNIGYRF